MVLVWEGVCFISVNGVEWIKRVAEDEIRDRGGKLYRIL